MTFVINSEDLDHNPDPSYDYQDLSYSVAVTNGTYSINVPAINTHLTVDVYFDDYNYDQIQADTTTVTSYKFFINPTTIGNVTQGATIVRNFSYNW